VVHAPRPQSLPPLGPAASVTGCTCTELSAIAGRAVPHAFHFTSTLRIYLFIYLFIHLFIYLYIYHLPIYVTIYQVMHLSTYLSI
jgi:hypothetical protein